jgi:large subunit ribosomal protein L31
MKKDIHPKNNPTIFVDSSCGVEFVTNSTLHSKETRDVDGTTYNIVRIEISSASHPFFTGKQLLVDTARRLEKFEDKLKKKVIAGTARKGKKVKRAARAVKKSITKA